MGQSNGVQSVENVGKCARPASGQRRPGNGQMPVTFTRQELSAILNLYGQFVAAGEWRDYAMDHHGDVAIFSVFRRASEAPLYRIEKRPKLARKQGAWAVIQANGVTLRRGHDLFQVLRWFDRQRMKLSD